MRAASSANARRSAALHIVPVGLCGQVTLISLVRGVTAAATASRSIRNPSSKRRSTVAMSQPIARGVSRLVA